MLERFRRGRELGRAAMSVLTGNPRLVVFPVISGLALLVLTAAIGTPILLVAADDQSVISTFQLVLMILGGLAWYFGCAFVIVFCNAAMISCAWESFDGGRVSLASGFAAAARRLPQILGWSALASTIGLVFRVLDGLSDKIGLLGQIIDGLAQGAWSVVTYFVLPVVVAEGVGPIDAVKRSSAILRKTWGETVGGSVGIGLRLGLFFLPLIGIVAVLSTGFGGHTVQIALGVFAGLYALAFVAAVAAAGSILRAGLYRYATTGAPSGPMSPQLLQSAFVPR